MGIIEGDLTERQNPTLPDNLKGLAILNDVFGITFSSDRA